jgi:hypothetical protein
MRDEMRPLHLNSMVAELKRVCKSLWTRFQIVLVTTMMLPEAPDAVGVNHRSAICAAGIRHVRATNRLWNRVEFALALGISPNP